MLLVTFAGKKSVVNYSYMFPQVLAASDADAEEEKVAGESSKSSSNVSF